MKDRLIKNILIKSHVMNNTSADEKALIGLGYLELQYDYQFSRAITEKRIQLGESYTYDTFEQFELTQFECKGVKFNMITCPAGGKVDIKDWGEQEIKKPFMLGETEVTQELFEAVTGYNNSKIKYLRNPVENVDWYDCLDFCNKLSDYFGLGHCYKLDQGLIFVAGANGFRLPKEWEWVIAALAGTNNKYAGTNDEESLGSVAWFSDNSNRNIPPIPHQALLDLFDISETSDVKTPHSVAQKIPNEWGFYDMTGNIWEWCENSEQPNDNNDGSIDRVIRGGCYNTSAWVSRTANRKSVSVDTRSVIGFRVARSLT